MYFALACDYLMHFLPSDPNVSVLPHIPHYTGKVPMAAPLQTANRYSFFIKACLAFFHIIIVVLSLSSVKIILCMNPITLYYMNKFIK